MTYIGEDIHVIDVMHNYNPFFVVVLERTTLIIIIFSLTVFIVSSTVVVLIMYRKKQFETALLAASWKIDFDDLIFGKDMAVGIKSQLCETMQNIISYEYTYSGCKSNFCKKNM